MIDRDLVVRKLVLIATDLQAARALAERDLAAYLASPTDELVAERYLERMIGRMIDVNYHLLVECGQPPPRDYFQSFLALGNLGVLAPELATRLAPSAGLRNRLVHEYDVVEPAKVHQALRQAMIDLPAYLAAVRAFLARQPS